MSACMIERVASELYAEWTESQIDEYVPWERLIDKETWLIRARRAVAAMREPTPEMIAEAWAGITSAKNANRIWRLGPGPGASDVWRAMIGHILGTTPSPKGEQQP